MLTTERTTGNAYTSDPDYYDFLGPQREAVIYDWSIRRWRKCKLQPLATPNDRVPPVDPDAAMAHEVVEGLEPDTPSYRPQRKTARLLLAINEALQERPLSTAELAQAIGASVNTVKHTMNNHPHGFEVLGRDVTGYVYGIKGRHYDRPVIGHGVRRVVDYLLEHGPRSSTEIMRDLKIAQFTFDEALRRGANVLVRVGLRPSGRRPSVVWGVRGVHKEQEAA